MISSYAEEMAHTSSQNRTHCALEQLDLVDDVHHPVIDRTQAAANVVNLAGAPDPKRIPRGFETTLTVEGFLRSAATTKHYSYRRSGRNVTGEKEQVGWTSDEEEYVPEKPARKRQRRKKKTQSLSARLLAAAVVTGVDVVGGLLFPDPPKAHISTVRPLPMSPGGRAPSPVDVAKSRRRQFVDPQKVDRAVSQFARNAEDASVKKVKQRRPITAWEPKDHVVLGLRSGSSFGKDAFGPVDHFATRPLTLVSSTHPHSAYRARCTTIISRSGLVPNRRKNETQRRERGLPQVESSRSRSILANLPIAPNGPHMRRSSFFAPNSSRPASPALHAPSVPTASLVLLERGNGERCDSSGVGDSTLSSSANVLPVPVVVSPSHAPSLLTPNHHLDEVLPSCGSERPPSPHDPLIAFKPPRPAALKPLKSLGSLLDGFREIARNATQMAAASQARRSMRLRPDTASKEKSDPIRSVYRSARSRPSTAQPLPVARSVRSQIGQAQVDVSPKSFFIQHSPEGGSIGDDAPALNFPRDSDACGGAGDSADVPPRTDRVDVAAILLPSSPLPGWNALPCSSRMGADDSEGDNNLY
ncbi:hypothetical protein LXA43DRAFT_401804 [Ganoderma leucocontextum]|nr:hypothetical protein LXA43DRAFT_401804 [Ganoderma leucocontextum]